MSGAGIGTVQDENGPGVAMFVDGVPHPLVHMPTMAAAGGFAHGLMVGYLLCNVASQRQVTVDDVKLLIEQTMLDAGLDGRKLP